MNKFLKKIKIVVEVLLCQTTQERKNMCKYKYIFIKIKLKIKILFLLMTPSLEELL